MPLTRALRACFKGRTGRVSLTQLRMTSLAVVVFCLSSCHTGGLEGESCTMHGDCASGLVCTGLVCRTGTATLMPTGKVCVTPQCTTNAQCQGMQTCSANKCTCTTDAQCGFGLKCSASTCVSCIADTDCFGGEVCNNGLCQPPCTTDGDCAVFNACQGNKCVFVGCKSDRECALAEGDVRSKCDTKTTNCYLPCETDVECGNTLTGGNWNNQICVQSRCQFVGCDNDADCIAAGDRNAQCVTAP
jgi:hypothetical protein